MKIVLVFLTFLIITLGGGGLYFLFRGGSEMKNYKSSEQTSISSDSNSDLPMKATVVYTNEGFSPKTLTLANGGEVEFINKSNMPLWVASDPHPQHTSYPEFDTIKILGGRNPEIKENTKFTFQKIGSWEYHNHTASGDSTDVGIHPGIVIIK